MGFPENFSWLKSWNMHLLAYESWKGMIAPGLNNGGSKIYVFNMYTPSSTKFRIQPRFKEREDRGDIEDLLFIFVQNYECGTDCYRS